MRLTDTLYSVYMVLAILFSIFPLLKIIFLAFRITCCHVTICCISIFNSYCNQIHQLQVFLPLLNNSPLQKYHKFSWHKLSICLSHISFAQCSECPKYCMRLLMFRMSILLKEVIAVNHYCLIYMLSSCNCLLFIKDTAGPMVCYSLVVLNQNS